VPKENKKLLFFKVVFRIWGVHVHHVSWCQRTRPINITFWYGWGLLVPSLVQKGNTRLTKAKKKFK